MALSVVAIKAAENRDKAYKLSDRDGLYLLVTPSGGRYWRMNYRYLGRQKTLAFGVWPDTGLADARAECDAARKVLARGEDPAERMKLDRIAATVAASNSFKAVADEWLLKVEKEGRSAVTMKKLRWLLTFINASIGKRPVASISAQELLLMLRKMSGVAALGRDQGFINDLRGKPGELEKFQEFRRQVARLRSSLPNTCN